jgi:hypothetical protein
MFMMKNGTNSAMHSPRAIAKAIEISIAQLLPVLSISDASCGPRRELVVGDCLSRLAHDRTTTVLRAMKDCLGSGDGWSVVSEDRICRRASSTALVTLASDLGQLHARG